MTLVRNLQNQKYDIFNDSKSVTKMPNVYMSSYAW